MVKTYRIEVDCANCAAKCQDAINKLDFVNSCEINFMTQKMLFDAEDEKFDELLKLAIKTGKKVEHDFEVKM